MELDSRPSMKKKR